MKSYLRNLPHSCDIKSPSNTRSSMGGINKSYTPVYTGQACRLIVKENNRANETVSDQKLITYKLLLPPNLTIKGDYMVENIITGNDVKGPFSIEEIIPHTNHMGVQSNIRLILEKVEINESATP